MGSFFTLHSSSLARRSGGRRGRLDFARTARVSGSIASRLALETPAVFVGTSHLMVPHLTGDNLLATIAPSSFLDTAATDNAPTMCPSGALEMYADHLREKPAVWASCPMTLKRYAGLPEYAAILATLDPLYFCPSRTASSSGDSLPSSDGCNSASFEPDNAPEQALPSSTTSIGTLNNSGDDFVLVKNVSGVQRLSIVDDFVEMAKRLKPDIVIVPVDRYPLSSLTSAGSSSMSSLSSTGSSASSLGAPLLRRYKKALARTLGYVDCIREGLKEEQVHMFASLPGAVDRVFVDKVGAVDGYAIVGHFAHDTTIPTQIRFVTDIERIRAVVDLLSPSQPVYYRGLCTLHDVQCLYTDVGIDIFDTSYPQALVEHGIALNYTLLSGEGGLRVELANLWDVEHEASTASLCQSPTNPRQRALCGCIACTEPYMRAYVHHLLHTKEMLAQVLLTSHNVWQYAAFLRELGNNVVRVERREGAFEATTAMHLDYLAKQ